MIITVLAFIFTLTFQLVSFGCIMGYGLATYEYAITQIVTFCWAALLLFSEKEISKYVKEDNHGTHQ